MGLNGIGVPRKSIGIVLVGIILSSALVFYFLFPPTIPNDDIDDNDDTDDEPLEPEPFETQELVPHGPIIIENPSDFVSQNWTGSGTSSDPYIIANLHIISEDYGIYINKPDACFKIINCWVNNAEYSSIQIYDCEKPFWITKCEVKGEIRIGSCRNGDISYSNLTSISPSYSSECSIRSNNICDAHTGIYLLHCSDIIVTGNIIHDCSRYSILMQHTENCTFLSNTLLDRYISMYGTTASTWHHEFSNNTINGKLIGYFWDVQNEKLEIDEYGCLIIANCYNVEIEDATISNTFYGIMMGFCIDCSISESIFENDDVGVMMDHITNCSVNHCIVESCNTGVSVSSYSCNIQDNFFDHNKVGVYCTSYQNATISNNTIMHSSDTGLELFNSMNLLIINNTISDSKNAGIYLKYSRDNTLQENVLFNNGIVIEDYKIWSWDHQIVNNTVNGKTIGYFKCLSNTSIDGSTFGQIIIVNCTNIVLNNGTFFNVSAGIQVAYCSNVTCSGVTSYENSKYGIYSVKSENLTIQFSTFDNNQYGAYVYDCPFTECINNSFIEDRDYGLYLHASDSTSVINCTVVNCDNGFYAGASSYSKFLNCSVISCNVGVGAGSSYYIEVKDSTLSDCFEAGIGLWASGSSTIQHNNIIRGHAGISIIYSTKANIISNTFTGSGIWITESHDFYYNILEWWKHNITDNTVNQKPILYLWNETGLSISVTEYGQVILANCTDITLTNGTFEDATNSILIGRCSNCTVIDCAVRENEAAGIYVETSKQIIMNNITSSGNREGGIHLVNSEDCSVLSSKFVSDGVSIDGSRLEFWTHSLVNNTVNGKAIAYFCNLANIENDTIDCGQLIVVACNNSEFSSTSLSSTLYVNNVARGIQVAMSINCTVSSFNVVNCSEFGVLLHKCQNVTLVSNNLNNNTGSGLRISASTFCVIKNNIICYNSVYGIDVWYYWYYGESYGNCIYGNDIGWNEIANARDIYSGNSWDDGISLGNRWSDYSGQGPYSIYSNYAVDEYPSLLV